MKSIWNSLGLAGLMASLAACAMEPPQSVSGEIARTAQAADTIFVGNNIITMDDAKVTAVAIAGEKIIATGSAASLAKHRGGNTRYVELGSRALLPGFIDAHGHLPGYARFIDLQNVSSPPVGEVKNIADIQRLLRQYIAERKIPKGQVVVGYGYDESLLAENRHPTRDDMDAVSTGHPIIILHVSLHLAVVNTPMLAAAGYDENTPNPSGGIIRRRAGTKIPNGVLEETAAQKLLFQQIASGDGLEDKVRRAMVRYASYGYTTGQDGAAGMGDVALLRAAAQRKPLPIDLMAYPAAMLLKPEQSNAIKAEPYVGGFRIAGVKHILDGSIQGKTGFLTKPYLEPPAGGAADYRGYAALSKAAFEDSLSSFLQRGVPVLIHSNGDAAIDMMLDGVEAAFKGLDIPDHRSVIIHAQMMREDQLDRAKKLGAVPSFFSAHPYFWGDWHRQILGEERASRISPIRSAIKKGVPFTIHNDAPVIPPDVMRLLWATVNRKTRSGYVLGADQKATVWEAIHATTLGAAYQGFEEKTKGSITPGKQADLVILGANPMTVDPDTIKDIKILETISRGRTVFKAE